MATTSTHLRGASELMLVASIKNGFVDHPDRLISYATRLGQLLEVLLQGRRAASEVSLLPGSGPIERLDTIYNTQWAIRQRPQRAELIVSAVFDASWEAYCRNLQANTGELLDAIFCHCEGYEQHTCVDHGYEAFSTWLREHQVQTRFFHSAAPDLTVSDLRGLRRFVAGDVDTRVAIGSVEQSDALVRSAWSKPDARERAARAVECEQALQGMRALGACFPKTELVSGQRTAEKVYADAIQKLLSTSQDASLRARACQLGLLLEAAPAQQKRDVPEVPPPRPEHIQNNILTTASDGAAWDTRVKHGCLVLLQCDDARAASRLLAGLLPRVASDGQRAELQLNVAFTHAGMTRLDLDASTLALLPPEFRQGMAQRAGLLGDVGPSAHPGRWEQLLVNWPEPSTESARLSSVDVVLLLQRAVAREASTPHDHVFDRAHPLYADLEGLARELKLEQSGTHILHVQPLLRHPSDHFNLGEESHAASQPIVVWPPGAVSGRSRHEVPLGEVLLGHPNRHGDVAQWAAAPQGKWLYENGTFLVVRKLQQDVRGFRGYIQRCVHELGVSSPVVHGWILGRHPADNRTLVAPGAPDPKNEFDYASPEASHCPLHAHVRRANPRLADTPRILRRSFPYGSEYDTAPDDTERGLVFMAYGASIAEQFEVIQRWLNGGNATGLPSMVNDLIAGVPQLSGAQRWAPGSGGQKLPAPERPFVSLRWGLYLFVPSLPALREIVRRGEASTPHYRHDAAAKRAAKKATKLGSSAPTRSVAKKAQRPAAGKAPPAAARASAPPPAAAASAPLDGVAELGRQIISDIFDIEDVAVQRLAWKEVLEEPARAADAGAVWSAIRHPSLLGRLAGSFPRAAERLLGSPPRTLPTPYGLLIATHAHAREIFGDDGSRFSVRRYRERLGATIQGHYLGLDLAAGEYAPLARDANAYLSRLPHDKVYAVARQAAGEVLATASAASDGPPASVGLLGLAATGIGAVAAEFLFTREFCGHVAAFVGPFIPISRYCFQPYPDEKLKEQAESAGRSLVPNGKVQRMPGPFAAHLRALASGGKCGAYSDEGAVRSAVIGAMVGFAPPAVAHAATLLSRWVESGELERHSRKDRAARQQAVLRAMTEVPVPATVYRQIQAGARLDDRDVQRLAESVGTEYVVVGTQSVTLDARALRLATGTSSDASEWQWLFAGDKLDTAVPGTTGSARPAVHGCPARHAAVAALRGIIDAVAEYPTARACSPAAIIPGAPLQR